MKQLKSGITLVEMIIYVGILTVVLGLTANIYYHIASYRVNQRVENALFSNSSFAMEKIKKDIKKAQSLELPIDSNYTNSLQLTKDGELVSWTVENGVLKRNSELITDNKVIVDMEEENRGFRKIGNSIQMRISLKTKQKRFGMPEKEKVYQTTVFYE